MRALVVLLGLTWALPVPGQTVRPFPPEFRLDRDSPWQREVEGRLTPRSAGVFVGAWRGWTNSLLLQATNPAVMAAVAPGAGGRILHFSLDGENILFDPAEAGAAPDGKTLLAAAGYQCDIGPESRGLPDRPQLLSGRHTWNSPGDWQVQVNSGRDAATGLEISKSIRLDPETGGLHLAQWLVNKAAGEASYCLRSRTTCKGGGFVVFPLSKKSRYSAGWALRRKVEDKFIYDGATPFSPRVRVLDGVLVAKAEGEAVKLGADTDAGWVAYARGRLLFVNFFTHEPAGNYSDSGNSLEVSWDAQSVELEPLSPEVKLRRYHPYGWAGRWILLPLEQPVTSYDQARSLAARVQALKDAAGKLDMAGESAPFGTRMVTKQTDDRFSFVHSRPVTVLQRW